MTGEAACSDCGCTETDPCEVDHRRPPGRLPADPAARLTARAERATVTQTCGWQTSPTELLAGIALLCTRCAFGREARRMRRDQEDAADRERARQALANEVLCPSRRKATGTRCAHDRGHRGAHENAGEHWQIGAGENWADAR